jgi:hypothetical protein
MLRELNNLESLLDKYPFSVVVKQRYAKGLQLILEYVGLMEDLTLCNKKTRELLSLAETENQNRHILLHAINGFFNAAGWASDFWETNHLIALLNRIEKLYKDFSEDRRIAIIVTRGLFHLTKHLVELGDKKAVNRITQQLKTIYVNNNEDIEIAFYLLQANVNYMKILGDYYSEKETIIDQLDKLHPIYQKFNQDEQISISYSKILVNAVRALGFIGQLDSMKHYLSQLQDFNLLYDNSEIIKRISKAYIDAIKAFGEHKELDKIAPLLSDLKDWTQEYIRENELQILYCKALVNTISSFGKNQQYSEMHAYLEELEYYSFENPLTKAIQQQYFTALSIAIHFTLEENDLNEIKELLEEQAKICLNYPNDHFFTSNYAKSLRKVLLSSVHNNDSKFIRSYIKRFEGLSQENPTSIQTQIEYARTISQLLLDPTFEMSEKDKKHFNIQLKKLLKSYPKNEQLNFLYDIIKPSIE